MQQQKQVVVAVCSIPNEPMKLLVKLLYQEHLGHRQRLARTMQLGLCS